MLFKKLEKLASGGSILVFIFFFTVVFLFRKILLTTTSNDFVITHPYSDIALSWFWQRSFYANQVKAGEIPVWNPYLMSGIPYIAVLQSAVFYPLNLLFLILPIKTAMNYTLIFHFSLSFLTMYLLAKRLGLSKTASAIASVVYGLSAFQVLHLYAGHLPFVTETCWTPLIFLFFFLAIERKKSKFCVLASLVLTIQFLSGHPQINYLTWLALFLYFLYSLFYQLIHQKDYFQLTFLVLIMCLIIMLFLGLSAIQLLPTYELFKFSIRRNPLSYQYFVDQSMPIKNLILLFVPSFFGDDVSTPYWGEENYWEVTIYLGILPAILILVSLLDKRNRQDKLYKFFLLLSGISLVLAFGKNTPLYGLFFNYVPTFNWFRNPGRFIFLATFGSAILSGYGVDSILKKNDKLAETKLLTQSLKTFLKWSVLFLSLCILCHLFLFVEKENSFIWRLILDKFGTDKIQKITGGHENELILFRIIAFKSFERGVRNFLFFFFLSCVLIWSSFRFSAKSPFINYFLSYSLILLVVTDLLIFSNRYFTVYDYKKTVFPKKIIDFFQAENQKELYRIATPFLPQYCTQAIVYGVSNIWGYEPAMIYDYSALVHKTQGLPESTAISLLDIVRIPPILDAFNLKYLVTPANIAGELKKNNPKLVEVLSAKSADGKTTLKILENKEVLPRAYIVDNYIVKKDAKEILEILLSDSFNPQNTVILEEEIPIEFQSYKCQNETKPNSGDQKKNSTQVKFLKYSTREVLLEVNLAKAPAILYFADVYYPGWRVFIDNNQQKIFKTNLVMRSVPIFQKGKHLVRFVYNPSYFRIGFIVSLLSLASSITFFIFTFPTKNLT